MIPYLLESSLCAIAFYAFYYFFLKDKQFHHWNRLYLIGTLVCSFIIPLLYFPIEEIVYVQQKSASSKPTSLINETPFDWIAIVLYIYLIGTAVASFRFAKELLQIRLMIQHAHKTIFPNYILARLDQDFPLCSFFNHIIASDTHDISEYELDHELGHIEQFHSVDKMLVEFAKIVLWFNPVIYFFSRSIHMTHEFLADQRVLAKHQTENYLQFLIQSLTTQQTSLHTLNPFHSLIKNRLKMIKNKKESTKQIFFLALPIIACLIFFVACEKTTKYIAEDESSQYAHLNFNENGEVVLRDTIIIFDDQTFEEEVRIVTNTMSLKEYQKKQLDKKIVSDVLSDVPFDDNSILITVIDTIVTFNDETFEESTRIVETKMTLDEYEQRKKEFE